jgi:DNA excision repair protein ERCC-2
MAFGLSFPEQRRRTYAVETPALFSSARDDPRTQETIAETLLDVIAFTPGNSLLFFPSYGEAERYHDLLEGTTDSTLHLDRAGVRAEGMRQDFIASEDATLFTSLWGTLTEGVSFDADDARTVAVVGVPYPYLDDRLRAVESAYGEAFGTGGTDDDAGWRYAVEIPTIRKTRQALGRVLRSPEDFGARLLLDERYTERATREMGKYAVRDTFPPEERAEITDVEPEKLKFALLNFYSDMDAYEGPPPTP